MKVYEINTVCGNGSTGRIAAEIAKMLQQQGMCCRVAYARGTGDAQVDGYRFGNKIEIYWHGIMTRLTDKHGMYSKSATRQLIKNIVEYEPDIIHLHNIHGYYLNMEMLFDFLKRYGKPVVWTLHDCWTYTGHCAYYSNAGCEKWKTQCSCCPQRMAYPGSIFRDNSIANYKIKKQLFTGLSQLHLVTPSRWLASEVKQSFFQDTCCTVIPNGIDLDVFKPMQTDLKTEWKLEDKKIILGVANVWDERKGLQDFVALAKLLDSQYQIVLVGLSDKQIKELPQNILGLKRTENQKELVELYNAAELYLNTSVEETMGLTTAEAIACGTPVIVYEATAIPETVSEGCGIVLPPRDVQRVKTAIEQIENNREAYSRACVKARAAFSKKEAYSKYYELYQQIIEEEVVSESKNSL